MAKSRGRSRPPSRPATRRAHRARAHRRRTPGEVRQVRQRLRPCQDPARGSFSSKWDLAPELAELAVSGELPGTWLSTRGPISGRMAYCAGVILAFDFASTRMKLRTRRLTTRAIALGAVVVSVLAIAHWNTVRDHFEAWTFQFRRATKTIEPLTRSPAARYSEETLLHVAANELSCPVIVDPQQLSLIPVELIPGTEITALLKKQGWRLLKQHLPRNAYVLIRANNPP
jgi:hypothetical protein